MRRDGRDRESHGTNHIRGSTRRPRADYNSFVPPPPLRREGEQPGSGGVRVDPPPRRQTKKSIILL